MLELRPNCELCGCDLPPAADARICSYECTYCPDCAETVLQGVCQNCGGNLEPRPVRPKHSWREGTGLGHHPAGTTRRESRYSPAERAALTARLKDIPPAER